MIGSYDEFDKGQGNNEKLINELTIKNLLTISNDPFFSDVISSEDLHTIKDYLTLYVRYSTLKMTNKMDNLQKNIDEMNKYNDKVEEVAKERRR